MKKSLIILSILLFTFFAGLAFIDVNYSLINEPTPKVRLQVPSKNISRKDTLGAIFYNSTSLDDLISSQVTIHNNYSTSGNQEIKDYMLQNGETDTLNAVARYIIATSGTSSCFYKVRARIQNQETLVLGLKYEMNVDSNNNITYFITFLKIATNNNRMVVASLSAQEIYLNPLILCRDRCFNSIVMY